MQCLKPLRRVLSVLFLSSEVGWIGFDSRASRFGFTMTRHRSRFPSGRVFSRQAAGWCRWRPRIPPGRRPCAVWVLRGTRSRDDLEPAERARHTLLMRAVLGYYDDTYLQFREGMCDSETWEVSKFALRQVVSAPGFL